MDELIEYVKYEIENVKEIMESAETEDEITANKEILNLREKLLQALNVFKLISEKIKLYKTDKLNVSQNTDYLSMEIILESFEDFAPIKEFLGL